ncbi:MAG: DUF1565 domain-containing protein [Planctomycetota bacterium]|nr:DUF1565 domain-containing protein [Planctomycetota bacterium]
MRPLLPLVLSLLLAPLLSACGGGGGGADPGDDNAAAFAFVVDVERGDDNNPGTDEAPFKTITRAMLVAQDGDVVRVRQGIYSEANGDKFPIVVPRGVTLLGDFNPIRPGTEVRLFGTGETSGDIRPGTTVFATIVPQERAVLKGLKLQNFGVHDAPDTIDVVVAAAAPAVQIIGCEIEAGNDHGISFFPGAEGLHLDLNRITICGIGMMFIEGGGVGTTIENTTVTDNRIGVFYHSGDGADLGGGAAGSGGNNRLFGNRTADLFAMPGIDVSARDNVWDGFPEPTRFEGGTPPAAIDIWTLDGSSDIDTTGARAVSPPLAPGT